MQNRANLCEPAELPAATLLCRRALQPRSALTELFATLYIYICIQRLLYIYIARLGKACTFTHDRDTECNTATSCCTFTPDTLIVRGNDPHSVLR